MDRRLSLAASAAVLAACNAVQSPAAVMYSVVADTADTAVSKAGSSAPTLASATATAHRVGNSGNNNIATGLTFVVPFQLPVLDPGAQIQDASFSVFYQGELNNGANVNYDLNLFYVRTAATAAVSTSDYGIGNSVAGNTLVQADFITRDLDADIDNDPGAVYDYQQHVSTSTAGEDALVALLQGIYDADPNAAGKFVFFRLNPDYSAPAVGFNGYLISSANDASTPPDRRPTLTIAVPEPSSAAVLGAGLAAGLRRRRGA
jgi:hypothetical protein